MSAWFATIAVISLLVAFNLYAVDTILKVRADVKTIRKNVATILKAVVPSGEEEEKFESKKVEAKKKKPSAP